MKESKDERKNWNYKSTLGKWKMQNRKKKEKNWN